MRATPIRYIAKIWKSTTAYINQPDSKIFIEDYVETFARQKQYEAKGIVTVVIS